MPELKRSPIEISFWENAKHLIPELQEEVWIDKYRVDFLIPSKKVIIELYGYEHHKTKQKITKDAERERYLQRLGYQIIRFTGSEIFKDVKKCVNEVLTLAKIEPARISTTTNIVSPKKDNYARTIRKNKISKMNKRQVALLSIMSITAFCCTCITLNTILNSIGK